MAELNKIESIVNGFVDFFKSLGYLLIAPEPLFPTNDKTISFTNATIVPLKDYFTRSYFPPGFVVNQPCLRLRNLDSNSYDSQFTSYFRMVSILSHPSVNLNETQQAISQYIKNKLGVESSRITLHANSQSQDLVRESWQEEYKLESGKFAEHFYSWGYGSEGITGRGVTFYVNTDYGDRELGNFVEIANNGKVIGYEFGFGIESALCAIEHKKDNFEVAFSGVWDGPVDGFAARKNISKKLLDLTAARLVILQDLETGDAVVSGSAKSSIRKIDHELLYEVYELRNGDYSYISEVNWAGLGVTKSVVKKMVNYIANRIKALKYSEQLLKDYVIYLEDMKFKGKTEDWAEKKLENYLTKNNYHRLYNLIKKNL